MYKIFIDGSEGTTGLQLQARLSLRKDIELLHIEEELHRDPARRKELMAQADIVILCLPDAAAIEAVELCDENTVIIDASTAHRVAEGWTYGLPELSALQRGKIAESKRIANPGCYATGAICILAPLVECGILPADYPVTINAISGYSGGGKKMIAAYEAENRDDKFQYSRAYGLSLHHKHLPEITKISGLKRSPVFLPQVCNFYKGMAVSVPLYCSMLNGAVGTADVYNALSKHYEGQTFINVEYAPESGFINSGKNSGTNMLTIYVCGNNDQLVLTSILDNLGKGASGAAMQNMNIALGLDEAAYLL